ncbi:MAG: Fic family protein [Patescibacteria group bacterium]
MYTPKFIITNKILKNIGAVEASKEVIENAPLVPSFEKQFQTDAIVRTIYHGTHIEGNDLTLIQTKKVLEGEQVYARARDVQEVINYRNVVRIIEEFSARRGDYELSMLLDVHRATVEKLVPGDKVGVLRQTQVVIKEEGTGKIILQPPDFNEVQFLLNDFFAWFNSPESKEVHPVLRAGIAHYFLVAVHPFVEGNGRTARAFATLILIREGYDIKRFFALEEHFDKDLAGYYDAFSFVDQESPDVRQRDLTHWIEYFTEVLAIELTKIKERVRKLSIDSKLKIKIGEQISLTERQMRLVEYISDQGSGIMTDLKRVLSMVSEDTILRDLKELLNKGIIKKVGSTKAARYMVAIQKP